MSTYLVERYLPGVPLDVLQAGVARCRQAAAEMRAEGHAVRHLGSLYVAGDELCLCRFTASSAELVEEVNGRAGFAYARISPARAVRATSTAPGASAGLPRPAGPRTGEQEGTQ